MHQRPCRHCLFFLALLLVLGGLRPALAADALKKPDGFRDIRWGAPASGIQGLNAVDRDGDIIHYDRSGDKMDLGGIPLRHITYSFYKGQFYHAEISYEESGAFAALERSLEEKYGPPDAVREKTDPSGHAYEIAIWNWPGSVFIGNRHEKGSDRGRIFYFYAPLTERSAKSQGVGPSAAPVAAKGQAQGAGQTYIVKRGDSLDRIARQFDISVSALSQANGGLTDKKLKADAKLTIPAANAPASAEHAQPAPAAASQRPPHAANTDVSNGSSEFINYTVKDGDILSKIASAHGVHTKDVLAANPDIKPEALRPGMVLRLPVGKPGKPQIITPPAATPAPATPAPTDVAPAPATPPTEAPAAS